MPRLGDRICIVKDVIESLGPVCAVIGAQWGDEGKGKITDILAEHFDVIARACGGANAGHTIVVNGKKHVFHLLPAGCLHADKDIVLGSGMVIHLPTLLEEISRLEEEEIDVTDRLFLSPGAHIVLDIHKDIDRLLEEQRKKKIGKGIGTTGRGIGPTYMDKAMRTGMRLESLWESTTSIKKMLKDHGAILTKIFNIPFDLERELAAILKAKKKLEYCLIANITDTMSTYLIEGNSILIEGAQGALLDIDHGTYPYVTSSVTTAAGALQGLGMAPQVLTSCIGVAKAYCTRVGEGDFVTEAISKVADRLRKRGGEYGATTGRPRRCGWLHTPHLRYAAILNGFTHWNITKLDVLDEEKSIPIGVGIGKKEKVAYKKLPGWKKKTSGIRKFSDLPHNARNFVKFIEEETGVPVAFIGTGEGRADIIVNNIQQ